MYVNFKIKVSHLIIGVVLLGSLLWGGAALAGDPDSSNDPASTTSFSLEDLYNRLNAGTTGTQSAFTEPGAGPGAGTMHTINEIMGAAPTLDNSNGATRTQVMTGKTYWGLRDGAWGPQTGTGTMASGNATDAQVLAGRTYSNDSGASTGIMPNNGAGSTIVPTTTNQSIAMGYWSSANTVQGDSDLTACNIKQGVTLFGVAGALISGPRTFTYTAPTSQTFTVPPCVTAVTIEAIGAQGGQGSGDGGLGGRVVATIAVTPGETLDVYVGEQGGASGAGGFNGGGASDGLGGGGGGASDVRRGGTRLVVAGGGGGGGVADTIAYGGAGGGTTGGSGFNGGFGANDGGGGGGGTQVAGGSGGGGGTGGTAGTAGASGSGGSGGDAGGFLGVPAGGGGGGFFGGGGGGSGQDGTGGSGGGGGGGSSYADPAATGVTHTQGALSGNGQVVISW